LIAISIDSSIFRVYEHRGEGCVPARVRVERRLANEPVHAALGAQVPVGVFARDLDRRTLDPCDLAVGLLEHLGGELLLVAVLEVHPLEHRGPVLRLGAAGAGLDGKEAVVRIERVGEHAAEFERRNVALDAFDILADLLERSIVVVRARHLEELARVGDAAADALERQRDAFQDFLLLAELLRALRVVPQLRVLELAVQRFEPAFLGFEVKDTSAARRRGRRARRAWRQSG
jgi:hypothetical protein